MSAESLQMAIDRVGNAVDLLRNLQARAHTLPIVAEHTNWQSEQRAWRDSCVLMDQSHHMTDLFVTGPDAEGLLNHLGVNSFRNFRPGKAKQYIVCSHEGYYIGDVILFYLGEESFNLVGREIVMDWLQFNAEIGDYNVSTERDDNSATRTSGPPKQYRFELQGPQVGPMMEALTGVTLPEITFFSMGEFDIAGYQVRALRHGMAGQPGYELFGPWAEGASVRQAILEVGGGFGLHQAGAKAYSTANLESGWVPPTTPGIFSGPSTQAFRKWLSMDNIGAIGGSLLSDDITDYYVTPYDLGYDRTVSFDHDFIGRDALERIAEQPPRTKVTLIWNEADVTLAMGSVFRPGRNAKLMNFPKIRYALYQQDHVLLEGRVVGKSMDAGFIANESAMVSLATVDREVSEPGTQVSVLWGENPVTAKRGVEPHQQIEIRATVAPAPLAEYARQGYRGR